LYLDELEDYYDDPLYDMRRFFCSFFRRGVKTEMSISLESSIRTCRLQAGWANRIQSDRFQNPNALSCPTWNGFDTAGRQVCADSFMTKRPGCNSADDRIVVENSLRPQYIEYVNLDAAGIAGDAPVQYPHDESKLRNSKLNALNKVTGNFGLQFGANVDPKCSNYPYADARAEMGNVAAHAGALSEGFKAQRMRRASGFGGQADPRMVRRR